MKHREEYVSPCIEVIKLENEGAVMSASMPGMGIESWSTNRRSGSNKATYGGTASSGDLEDLINDILTVED